MTTRFEDLKTVAEQSAFEFGSKFFGENHPSIHTIARRYAFAHQYALFPRSDTGYARLKRAFLAGAGFTEECAPSPNFALDTVRHGS